MVSKKILQKIGNFIYITAFILSIFGRFVIGVMSFCVLVYFIREFEINVDVNVLRFYAIAILAWIFLPFLEGLNFNKVNLSPKLENGKNNKRNIKH